jgi:hypothetical protein
MFWEAKRVILKLDVLMYNFNPRFWDWDKRISLDRLEASLRHREGYSLKKYWYSLFLHANGINNVARCHSAQNSLSHVSY